MSVVPCLPAHLCVSPQRPVAGPPRERVSTIHSLGGVDVTTCLGDETVTQHCRVLETDTFDIVIGTDFLRRNPQVKMLSLQRPYSLHCDFGSGLFSVPLEPSGPKESGLRYASKTNYLTENYQLARHVLENGLAALQVNLDEIQVELFASHQQHIMQLYCSKQLNNAFRFFWKAMGLAYANPPFSLLAKVLTKIAYEGGRVVMCTPRKMSFMYALDILMKSCRFCS